MATTTTNQPQQQHLPHSPPPSPPTSRNKHKKRLSSYQKLAATTLSSPPESPPNEPAEDEPLLTKIILTPVLFTSFLLSLFLVNYRDRARRREAQASHSLLEYFYPSTWLDPEPYQDPHDSTWDSRNAAGHVEPNAAIAPKEGTQGVGDAKKRRSWHLNKKIRKVAKLEISDAFEMRGRIVVGMAAVLVCFPIAVWMGFRWLWVALLGAQT